MVGQEHKGKTGKALLLAVRDTILAEPLRLDMGNWMFTKDPVDGGPVCGTVGCIAGWAAALNHGFNPNGSFIIADEATSLVTEYGKYKVSFLNQNGDTENYPWLFHVQDWPADLQSKYCNRPSKRELLDPAAVAAVTAEAIDRFIAEVYK